VSPSLLRPAVWVVTGIAAIALAPPVEAVVRAGSAAPALGAVVGLLLFAVLARRRVSPAAVLRLPRRRLLARTLLLTTKSAQEEAVWRGLLLGALAGPLGRLGALAASSAFFALAHIPGQGRRGALHAVTGAAFGGVYLATGRLDAAIAAHAVYNVSVGTCSLAKQPLPVTDTRHGSELLLRSALPSVHDSSAKGAAIQPVDAGAVAILDAATKSFGAVRALESVDLELRPGEIVGLLGPNGAGKSTAVSLLLGLRRPDAGRALLFGADPRRCEARRRIGVVLQDVSFPPTLRVDELVDLVRAHFADPADRDDLLDRLGLGALSNRQAGGLSGGQRRRLALALALAGRPAALFLDEPTAALDAGGRRALWQELSSFAALGGSVLLTTQQLDEAERYATRLVVLARGRVLLQGSVGEVRARAGKARVSVRAQRVPAAYTSAVAERTVDRHVLYVDDADAFVGELVSSGIPFRELEVSGTSLEDAFVSLTAPHR
jgi:ABC-2 type transport system ATP-binding protein